MQSLGFQLECDMPDAAPRHPVADLIENPLVMHGVVQDGVSAERYETARERPHVKIMNVVNVGDGPEVLQDAFHVHMGRHHLEKHPRRLLHQTPGSQQDETRNDDGDDGVDGRPPGQENQRTRPDGADGPE